MNTVVRSDSRIKRLRVTQDEIIAELVDGHVISVPLAWSWRLAEANAGTTCELSAHWEALDRIVVKLFNRFAFHLSVCILPHGRPPSAPAAKRSHRAAASRAAASTYPGLKPTSQLIGVGGE
jgi:hypothetical protein